MSKKILALYIIALSPFVSFGQSKNSINVDSEIFHICSSIFMAGLVMVFIITVIKKMMDLRIKNKIIEKGISEPLASALLKNGDENSGNPTIKWICIFCGIGIGLIIIKYSMPLGVHSLAIMAFCLALSFWAYFIIGKRKW